MPGVPDFNTYTLFSGSDQTEDITDIWYGEDFELRVKWKSATSVSFYVDGNLRSEHTTDIGSSENCVQLFDPDGNDIWADWAAVREIPEVEPADSDWGDEESLTEAKTFETIYDIESAAEFETIYDIKDSKEFQSVYDIDLFEPLLFETVIDMSVPFSVEFRTRVKGVVGISTTFEEIV